MVLPSSIHSKYRGVFLKVVNFLAFENERSARRKCNDILKKCS